MPEVIKLTINPTSLLFRVFHIRYALHFFRRSLTCCFNRKKYKKLRFKFDQVMKRSDELFKQDQIASAAIKRIQEENTCAMKSFRLFACIGYLAIRKLNYVL